MVFQYMKMFEICQPIASSAMAYPFTQSAAGSHARTSALLEPAAALTGHAAGCGEKWHDSFASYDRATSSWKMSQRCFIGGSAEFSGTWPRSGMMRSGIAYRLPPVVSRTFGIGSGLLPTPTTSPDDWSITYDTALRWLGRRQKNLGSVVHLHFGSTTGRLSPLFVEEMMGFPTRWTEAAR